MPRKAILILLAVCLLLGGCSRKRPAMKDKAATREGSPARNIALPEQFVWTLEPEEMAFPAIAASGSIHGLPFTPEQVQLQSGALRFRSGKALPEMEVEVPLGLALSRPVEGQRITRMPGKAGLLPVFLAWRSAEQSVRVREKLEGEALAFSRRQAYSTDYALKVEFDKAAGGRIPGRIYLCIADETKSYLAGSFSLEAGAGRSTAARPPGPEDAPFVRGRITVKGQGKEKIEVGYIGQPEQGNPIESWAVCVLEPGGGVSTDVHAPRTTRVAVSEKDSATYVCRRLPPGRYFFYACWKERGMAWRWIDVRDGDQLSVDFTIDPTKTGSLQVKSPTTVTSETMLLIPLDNGRFPALPFSPLLVAQRLKTEARIQESEATLDRLPEGAYRVLVGDARALVEIRAGRTIQLDMTRMD